MAFALGFALLAASYCFGGWYWCLVCFPVVVEQLRRSAKALLLAAVPGLVWLTLFALTGDRRLFFPFTMYQAVMLGQSWQRGFAGGCGVVLALFVIIRIDQEASIRVLAVEMVVAVVAASVGAVCRRYGPIAAPGASSLVALAGLAV